MCALVTGVQTCALPISVGTHSIAEVGEVKKLDLFEFIEHVFPKNIFQAMAENNVLQILVFALFAGVGLTAIGERGKPLVRGAEALRSDERRVGNECVRTRRTRWSPFQ